MQSSQRGSVLLAIIAGIVLLSVLGMAMVSLMTDSVMTGVDGKETVQAAYLAESGKEIVRARTAKQDGGALMEQAQDLESTNAGKGLAVGTAGSVKLRLFPSWFRWYNNALNTTHSGWYGKNPADSEHLWLAVSQSGARVYKGKLSGSALDFGTTADVYLVGRVKTLSRNINDSTLTVTPADGTDDFAFFPESGGLIGLVPQQTGETFPVSTTVDTVRFTYDRKTVSGSTYTFTNLTQLTSGIVSFEGKNLALGQYFRVVSEGTTTNGARAALIWHTNGRNSLRFPGMGTGNEGLVGGSTAGDLTEIFGGTQTGKDDDVIFGDNIIGNLESNNNQLEWEFDITGSNNDKIAVNHFLKKGNLGGNHEYWYAAVAMPWLAYTATTDSTTPELSTKIQYSFRPDETNENYFTGVLFRLGFLSGQTVTSTGTVQQKEGAKGLGIGLLQGNLELQKESVQTASVNPALLPGFQYTDNKKFKLVDPSYYNGDINSLCSTSDVKGNKSTITLKPLLVLWEYDDTQDGTASGVLQTLKPLAIAVLNASDVSLGTSDYLSLFIQDTEINGENQITVWIQKRTPGELQSPAWPEHPKLIIFNSYSKAISSINSFSGIITTSLATGENYRRVGIFSEAYAEKSGKKDHADIIIGNFFFTGTNAGDSGDTSGLTPGLIQ